MSFYLANSSAQGVLRFFRHCQVDDNRHFREQVLRGGREERFRALKRLLTWVLRRQRGNEVSHADNSATCKGFFFLFVRFIIFYGLRESEFLCGLFSFFYGLRRAMILSILNRVSNGRYLASGNVPYLLFLVQAKARGLRFVILMELCFKNLITSRRISGVFYLRFFLWHAGRFRCNTWWFLYFRFLF